MQSIAASTNNLLEIRIGVVIMVSYVEKDEDYLQMGGLFVVIRVLQRKQQGVAIHQHAFFFIIIAVGW